MRRTRDRGIWIWTHLILGFPWETREEMVQAADIISDQGVNFLKLHHLHIVQNTVYGVNIGKSHFLCWDWRSMQTWLLISSSG